MTAKNGLFSKIARIMGAIETVPKDAKNDFHKYLYTSDASVYRAVREKMAAEGVAVFASMTGVEQFEGTTSSGKFKWHTVAHFEFTLADGESGETYTCRWSAEADDQEDKGINKCATAALKYWLLKTFIIPTGDDPDGESLGGNTTTEARRQSRRISDAPKRTSKPARDARKSAPAPKPDAPKAAPWYASDRLSKMVDWAAETLWMGELERPHAINRLAVALGVKGTPNGDFNALAEMVAAQLSNMSDDEAMYHVQMYEPQSDGTRKKAS